MATAEPPRDHELLSPYFPDPSQALQAHLDQLELDLWGAEPLEGSGFETEPDELGFAQEQAL